MSLSKLLGHALLQSAYMALILYAVVRIFDGLFLSALSIPPLARLGLVTRHRGLAAKPGAAGAGMGGDPVLGGLCSGGAVLARAGVPEPSEPC